MATLLQLEPWLPFVTDDGRKVWAILALDYGVEHDTLFLVGHQVTRELWWVPNSRLRLGDNVSLGRMPITPPSPEPPRSGQEPSWPAASEPGAPPESPWSPSPLTSSR